MGTTAPEKWIVTEPKRIIRPAFPLPEAAPDREKEPAAPLPERERELVPA